MIAPAPAPMALDSSPSSLADGLALAFARLAAGLLLPGRAALQQRLELPRQLALPLGGRGPWRWRRWRPGTPRAPRCRPGSPRCTALQSVEQLLVVGVEAQDALGQVLHLPDAPAEVGVAGAEARRHLGQRRGGRGVPGLLAGREGLLQQRAAIGAGLARVCQAARHSPTKVSR